VRLFTGIALEADLGNRAGQVLSKCARVKSGVKWVKRDLLHLTLRFFGEQPDSLLTPLKEALSEAAGLHGPFALELGDCGAFPDLDHPRVLFVPVLRGGEILAALSQDITRCAAARGFAAPEETFHPHLTLGRVKSSLGVADAVRELKEVAPHHLGKMKADRFRLFESRLLPAGPEYRVVDEFPLNGLMRDSDPPVEGST
jgi:2'-5' RNA ligase